ncbi:MAG: MarR family winged helix-turn-helix transcriptional regulator [Longimicrobiales bacterium]
MSTFPRILFACRSRQPKGVGNGPRVSAHQAHILAQLDVVDPAMVGELAGSLGVTASTMSLNLKRLREAGLVTCERDPEDRRVMNVRLTGAGELARDAARPLDAERVEAMLDGLWPEDRRRAVEALSVLADAAEILLVGGGGRVGSGGGAHHG